MTLPTSGWRSSSRSSARQRLAGDIHHQRTQCHSLETPRTVEHGDGLYMAGVRKHVDDTGSRAAKTRAPLPVCPGRGPGCPGGRRHRPGAAGASRATAGSTSRAPGARRIQQHMRVACRPAASGQAALRGLVTGQVGDCETRIAQAVGGGIGPRPRRSGPASPSMPTTRLRPRASGSVKLPSPQNRSSTSDCGIELQSAPAPGRSGDGSSSPFTWMKSVGSKCQPQAMSPAVRTTDAGVPPCSGSSWSGRPACSSQRTPCRCARIPAELRRSASVSGDSMRITSTVVLSPAATSICGMRVGIDSAVSSVDSSPISLPTAATSTSQCCDVGHVAAHASRGNPPASVPWRARSAPRVARAGDSPRVHRTAAPAIAPGSTLPMRRSVSRSISSLIAQLRLRRQVLQRAAAADAEMRTAAASTRSARRR